MTLLLRDGDVRAVCDIGSMAAFLDQALRKEAKGVGAQLPERLNLAHGNVFLRVMPALLPEAGLLGLKFFHGSMQDGVRYVVAVCSLDTGEVLGLIDAAYLTAARTGATSGVATQWLSREDSSSAGVIGSGMEAETNLRAVCSVRPVTRATVYSRSPQRREAFAARMTESLGIPVTTAMNMVNAMEATVPLIEITAGAGIRSPLIYGSNLLSKELIKSRRTSSESRRPEHVKHARPGARSWTRPNTPVRFPSVVVMVEPISMQGIRY